MAKQGPNRNKRVPKLSFTDVQGIGWHVTFRDASGVPRRHRFGIKERSGEPQARLLYHAWILEHLGGENVKAFPTRSPRTPKPKPIDRVLSGSILEIASGFLDVEQARARQGHEPRRRGTIAAPVFRDRKKQVQDFLAFLDSSRGTGAAARMRISDLTLEDIEAYNRHIVKQGFSASQVAKRLHLVKAIIDRAGRPEHGRQLLTWNWDSRDVVHGRPPTERILPSRQQILRLLRGTDLRGRTMIWLGIGLGFGARDLAAIRVGQITKDAYDLRRSKTGMQRYGETPPLVWRCVSKYQERERRSAGQFLFVTRRGVPLVQPTSNAVTQWWDKLRKRVGESRETLPGFYTLRHLGATEFGSRPGTSIGEVKRWLGHSASSDMADVYMRPVRPEYREVVEWVRKRLHSSRMDEAPSAKKAQGNRGLPAAGRGGDRPHRKIPEPGGREGGRECLNRSSRRRSSPKALRPAAGSSSSGPWPSGPGRFATGHLDRRPPRVSRRSASHPPTRPSWRHRPSFRLHPASLPPSRPHRRRARRRPPLKACRCHPLPKT